MQRYRFTQDYRSSVGAWHRGDEYDFDPGMAAFIERDSPGTIELVPGTLVFVPEVEESEDEESEDEATRVSDGPPHDRMVKSARKRGS